MAQADEPYYFAIAGQDNRSRLFVVGDGGVAVYVAEFFAAGHAKRFHAVASLPTSEFKNRVAVKYRDVKKCCVVIGCTRDVAT